MEKLLVNPLNVTRRVKSVAQKMISALRRKQLFSSAENLKPFHYNIINDLASNSEEHFWEGKRRNSLNAKNFWLEYLKREGQTAVSSTFGEPLFFGKFLIDDNLF